MLLPIDINDLLFPIGCWFRGHCLYSLIPMTFPFRRLNLTWFHLTKNQCPSFDGPPSLCHLVKVLKDRGGEWDSVSLSEVLRIPKGRDILSLILEYTEPVWSLKEQCFCLLEVWVRI